MNVMSDQEVINFSFGFFLSIRSRTMCEAGGESEVAMV